MSGDKWESATGGVLGAAFIHARSSEIFASGYSESSLERASYDLRIATTKMILPSGQRIREGEEYTRPFMLEPGSVAFVSSLERVHIPYQLCGIVSIKFSYASQGILMLMGMGVDPGYGQDEPTAGGRRLHFVVANVGLETLQVRPGEDLIASLQLLPVLVPQTEQVQVAPPPLATSPSIIDDLFNRPDLPLGLSFFQRQADLEHHVSTLNVRVDEHVRGLNQVVLFGHFLLGTAITGGLVTLVLGWAGENSLQKKISAAVDLLPTSPWAFLSLLLIFVVVFGLGPLAISRAVGSASQLLIKSRLSSDRRGRSRP